MNATASQTGTVGLKRFAIGLVIGLVSALFLAPIVWNVRDHLVRAPVAIPNEQIAGLKLLAEKFTGPRYFQPEDMESKSASAPEKYYISIASAKRQLKHIASERKLSDEQVSRVNAIIEQITEPPPSRVLGQNSVNVLRLNLALDEMH
jgi:K+-transporting ATPase c subunit